MSKLEALQKAGFNLRKQVGKVLELDVPEHLVEKLGKTVKVPIEVAEKSPGKVIISQPKEEIGRVLVAPDKPMTTSYPELLQANEQAKVIQKEKALEKLNIDNIKEKQALGMKLAPLEQEALSSPNLKTFLEPKSTDDLKRIRTEKEALAKDNREKVLGKKDMAAIAGLGSTDMSPLQDIKAIYDKYTEAKNALLGVAAEQMDLTKDRSAKEGIQEVLSTALDPINLVPGAPGLALGALTSGIEALPKESKVKDFLSNRKGR